MLRPVPPPHHPQEIPDLAGNPTRSLSLQHPQGMAGHPGLPAAKLLLGHSIQSSPCLGCVLSVSPRTGPRPALRLQHPTCASCTQSAASSPSPSRKPHSLLGPHGHVNGPESRHLTVFKEPHCDTDPFPKESQAASSKLHPPPSSEDEERVT